MLTNVKSSPASLIDNTTPLNDMIIVRNILVINRDRVPKIVVVIILHFGLPLMSGQDGSVVVRGDFAQTDAAEDFQVNPFFIRQVFLQFLGSHNQGRVVICLSMVNLYHL